METEIMSHGINENDTMLSVRETPWHGLGIVLDDPPTVAEALALAGLDWTVKTEPAYRETTIALADNAGTMTTREQVPAQVVTREDSGEVLGVVGTRWRPVQNSAALAWFDRWIDTGMVTIETAGSLFGGRRVWALARIVADPIVVMGDDVVRKFILIAHSHDGTLAIRAGLTAVRVVCNNTLGFALEASEGPAGNGGLFKVQHTANALTRLEDVADEIERADARLNAAGDLYRELAHAPILGGDATIAAFVGAVYGQTPEQVADGRRLAHILRLFATGQGSDLLGASGTYWGLYNAITEYETHGSAADPNTRSRESRADRNVFGSGARTLTRALDVAIAMARRARSIEDIAREFGSTGTAE
jgi:phage/plasmid-like protein (TIGR03299 family)